MTTMKHRKTSMARMAGTALLLLFLGACKSESPTAPPPGSGGSTGGGNTPPATGVTLTLAASNADPLVDSTVTITAQVSQNGQPVVNGTAVQFAASDGSLDSSGTTAIIKTTTNGVATVTLTSSVARQIRVSATVNNVSRTVDVTFRSRPVTPPVPSTEPTISSISPSIGIPGGGQTIRITGTNFRAPVRVLFDVGLPLPVEGFVVAVTETTIDVVTPPVQLGAGQQLIADIIVITEAGAATEQRVERTEAFTYRNEQLTPVISTTSPNSGPITGGTIVTIFGEGFQPPVQVMFGDAEARVISVDFAQIVVEAPAGRDTSEGGSDPTTGFVPVSVRNINSNKEATLTRGFRYVAQIVITAISPMQGPTTGGTRITIDGNGFVAPVVVMVGDAPAQPVSVTGTRIVAVTSAVEGCADVSGPVTVTNIVDGSSASSSESGSGGMSFTYKGAQPTIISVSPTEVTAGGTVTVTIANALPGVNRFTLGTRSVFPTSSNIGSNGTGTFTLAVPSNFVFATEACTVNGVVGEREVAQDVDITYLNVDSNCTDTANDVLTISPDDTSCVLPPPAEVVQVVPVSPNCASAGSVDVDGATGTATITFRNDGGRDLSLTPTVTGANASDFTIAPATLSVLPAQTGSFTVTFNPSAEGARTATASFVTNDTDENPVNVCLTGTGVVPAP